MSKETRTSFDVQDDLRTDYALIITGVGAALVALVYLPAGLNPSRKRAGVRLFARFLIRSARQSIKFMISGSFHGAAASGPERVPRKSVKRGACCDC
ncbi:hypothetical protein [Bradyrhizobium sp. UNPA324]|uniref:hypothetical protein n=1 Tax=Bradyrhizobium sp. UNPA324 TaxID=1141174 RepID=UPI001151B454|nr:hypothetical protein [Bradyrhizobium sp. UNPA324]